MRSYLIYRPITISVLLGAIYTLTILQYFLSQGKGFEGVGSMDDYVVQLGLGPCQVDLLTDNQIDCIAPHQSPASNDNYSLYCDDDYPPVLVTLILVGVNRLQ